MVYGRDAISGCARELSLADRDLSRAASSLRVADESRLELVDFAAFADKGRDIQVVLLDGAPDGLSHGC
jgi:hypothetical protein